MATINYLIKGQNNPTVIYLRFKNGRSLDTTVSTSLLVNPGHWSQSKQKIKPLVEARDKDHINSQLEKLKLHLFEQFNLDNSKGALINNRWLKTNVESFFNRSTSTNEHEIYFTSYMDHFIKEAPKRVLREKQRPVLDKTIARYRTTCNRIKDYETILNKRLRLDEINLKFHKDYLVYMFDKLQYGGNTVGKDIALIKMVCREAKSDGLIVNSQVEDKNFYIPTAKTQDTYLNEHEINMIFNYDLADRERLDNVRDLFIIGLRTGLRVSDFMRLKTTNLKRDFIEIKTLKTGKEVAIPLHSQVGAVLRKRNGKFPSKISDQKFNEYVKELCQLVGIDEVIEGKLMNPETKRKEFGSFAKYRLISSHTCRRSFASNLYGQLPTPVIMSITGHSTESSFLKYIKISSKENAETLNKFWKRQAAEQGLEEVKMRIVNS